MDHLEIGVKKGLASVAGNEPVALATMARATALGERIRNAVAQRREIVAARALDPAFCVPAANDYVGAYRLLSTLAPDEISRLRHRAQPYSGLYMMGLPLGRDIRAVESVDVDALLPRVAPPELVAAWRAAVAQTPQAYWFRPPNIAGEAGWWVEGVIVNGDTLTYQERMNLLHEAGIFARLSRLAAPRILEIGGGYGALACAVSGILPHAAYTICDLPESLLFSGLYLTLAGRDVDIDDTLNGITPQLRLLPNYLFQPLLASGETFDLVINTLSLAEMSGQQARIYIEGAAALLAEGGGFFEQNQDNRHMGLLCIDELAGNAFAQVQKLGVDAALSNGRANLWSHVKRSASAGS